MGPLWDPYGTPMGPLLGPRGPKGPPKGPLFPPSPYSPPYPIDGSAWPGLAWLGFGRLAWFALASLRGLSQLASPQLGLSQEQQQQPAFGGLRRGFAPPMLLLL